MDVLLDTNLPDLFSKGKVRDSYILGDKLLIVATDRISAFDSVLPQGIPYKGMVLNQLSAFWFEKTANLVPNHYISVIDNVEQLKEYWAEVPSYLVGRSMLVNKADVIDIECIVRGYISGSAWSSYKKNGMVCGVPLGVNLKESQQLVEPMFTPTTKATQGHDEELTIKEMINRIGSSLTRELIEKSVAIYTFAEAYAREKGIIIADTKMEFGLVDGKVILVDELLTPDSSRFWNAAKYAPGKSQESYDKQFVRDWLIESGWDKEPPAPSLSPEVVAATSERYLEAYRIVTGKTL